MTLQQNETKIMSILEIKRIRMGLNDSEKSMLNKLQAKYRRHGKLKNGSYFINANREWQQVEEGGEIKYGKNQRGLQL